MKENTERSRSFFVKGLLIFWDLLGDEKSGVVKLTLLILISETISLMVPFTLSFVFDVLPEAIGGEYYNELALLLSLVALMLIFRISLEHFAVKKAFCRSIINFENSLPIMAQQKVLELHQEFHESENTGKKASKIIKGCERLLGLFEIIFEQILPRVFFLFVNCLIMFTISPTLAFIFFVAFIPSGIFIKRTYDKRIKRWESYSQMSEQSNTYLCQSMVNIETVQGYAQEKRELEKTKCLRREMKKLDLDVHLPMENEKFFISLILQTSYLIALAVGIWFVIVGRLDMGALVYLIATGGMSIGALKDLVESYSRSMKNLSYVYRFKKLLDAKSEVLNESSKADIEYGGNFVFQDVQFAYGGVNCKSVITDLNIQIESGQMIALVGKSGCGKSTIIRLLARVYDISTGQITLDGVDIKTINRDWYRRLFATVQQDVDIFDTSLYENVAYACPEATRSQVLEAVNVAHLKCVIDTKGRFSDGLNTQVGEQGVRLSGGEKQRVGIARAYLALLNGAKVLILDEATSSLDSEAERAIQEMILKLRKEMDIAIVAIAHRLSTIEKADKIYVIGDGKVLEEGDHGRLVARNGLYSRLVKLQKLGELRE